jgi:hypothetical protein
LCEEFGISFFILFVRVLIGVEIFRFVFNFLKQAILPDTSNSKSVGLLKRTTAMPLVLAKVA